MNQKKRGRGRPPKNQEQKKNGSNDELTEQPANIIVNGGKEEKTEVQKLEELQEEFKESEDKKPEPKKKSAYKTKKEREQEEEQKKESFTKNVSGIGSTVMDIFLDRAGYEKLDSIETEKLNETLDNVIMKYVSVVGDFQEETALGMVLLMILLPRTKILSKKKIENE